MHPSTNIIRLFDFYIALVFTISLWRRRRVYIDTIRLIWSTLGKRRRLLSRLELHKNELLSQSILFPLFMVIGLTALQWTCSRLIWPQAKITVGEVGENWRWILILTLFVPMFCVDLYFLIRVGKIDRGETEKYLDYAEGWLGWKGPLVRTLTLGFVNPIKILDLEVQRGLQSLGQMGRWTFWWTSLQMMLRFSFGLCIWLLWATYPKP